MADKKIEKALYGPSMTEVALGAVLGLIAGVLAACIYLVFKPVSQVKEMPKEDKIVKGMVYFIPGNESNAKSRNWQAKQKQMTSGTTFTLDLVEDELNAWANTLSAPPAPAPTPPKGAKAPAAAPADAAKPAADGIFNPGRPNFRIVDGRLQIGTKCVLNWYGLTYETTVITTGTSGGNSASSVRSATWCTGAWELMSEQLRRRSSAWSWSRRDSAIFHKVSDEAAGVMAMAAGGSAGRWYLSASVRKGAKPG